MRKRDKLHARKDPRYKTIKHEVQKKLCAAYWQYVEEIIPPTSDEDSMGANKSLWGLFNLTARGYQLTNIRANKSPMRLVRRPF